MNDKLDEYVDGVFAPYEGAKRIGELKADLLAVMRERFRELKAEGRDDTAAFELTIDTIRTVAFDGARMDKLTYAGLQGIDADLSNVTVG
ncbi:MAG: hypothetical protein JO345_15920 [Streptosporangiaceae bacterium]|nr:hypothetical protein [Streptosporangiaceae bacterium]